MVINPYSFRKKPQHPTSLKLLEADVLMCFLANPGLDLFLQPSSVWHIETFVFHIPFLFEPLFHMSLLLLHL